MPNYCECDLRISGSSSDVEAFLQRARSVVNDTPTVLDFNSFVPMPMELKEVQSGWKEQFYKAKYGSDDELRNLLAYKWVKNAGVTDRAGLWTLLKQRHEGKDVDAIADQYKANIDRYGFPTWHEWRVANWGTKWNACDPEIMEEDDEPDEGEILITFWTAWAPPLPVIRAASQMFPTIRFELRYFESNAGFNGILMCEDGEVRIEDHANYYGDRGG